MIVDARVEAWAALQALARCRRGALVELLRAFGGPEAVLAATPAQRRRRVAPTAVAARARRRPADPSASRATLAWLAQPGQRPRRLGRRRLSARAARDRRSAAGALLPRPARAARAGRRSPSSAAATRRRRACADAAGVRAALSTAGLTIVSGLALGIDAAAHRGALAGAGQHASRSSAPGLDRVYPARNRDLAHAHRRARAAAVRVRAGHAAAASRTSRGATASISGLARGVLVVEATLSSGSLITARLAAEQGREVFAIPGSIHSPFSKGCHQLIREGAKLVETAQDILDELRLARRAAAPRRRPGAPRGRRRRGPRRALLAALGHDPADIDTLVARTGPRAAATRRGAVAARARRPRRRAARRALAAPA